MLMKNFVLFFLFVFLCKIKSETVNLKIGDGEIQGLVNTTTRDGTTYYNFRGIPYAKPPLQSLRFTSPVKNSAWNGTYDATQDRSQCIQNDGLVSDTIVGNEDCLYINVYTPDISTKKLPVLVWIYGGAFLVGNSSYSVYGPDYFLEQGLVFVSFNYRLGIFGFLSTADEACPGNWGLKDQILALHWVQENIAYFGGNPENVTIFGESAGSASVHLLMQTNLTKGLFHGAIMNSGTSLNLWSLNTRASRTSTNLATSLGIPSSNTTYLVEQLRTIDAKRLHKVGWRVALKLFSNNALRGLPWGPVMEPDVDGAVLINPSEYALTKGRFNRVPVLMGINSHEAAVFSSISILLRLYVLKYDSFKSYLTPFSMTTNKFKRFVAGREIYHHFFGIFPIAADGPGLVDFVSADQFDRPIRQAATLMSHFTTVYFYVFGYEGGTANATERQFGGTGHAEDLNYLFKIGSKNSNFTKTDVKVSQMLVSLWSNFVKHANPTPSEDEEAVFNEAIWNPVNATSSNFNYMSLNESMVAAVNPKQEDWEFYQDLWKMYGDKSKMTTY
ncbi:unnamed protein product [Ceutorhynchus assimilis]|uniref:Carboxylic ester hydrolase n=1 Tax=Ceutorhynchus assimilis TaxID=467358 RepID=A0A9N9QLF8_9CUCU|nr:unnamed protein product [Ceutorhynchus assimilis]